MSRRRAGIWLVAASFLGAFALIRFAAIDASSHSASDTLRPLAIELAIAIVLAALVAILLERLVARGRDR